MSPTILLTHVYLGQVAAHILSDMLAGPSSAPSTSICLHRPPDSERIRIWHELENTGWATSPWRLRWCSETEIYGCGFRQQGLAAIQATSNSYRQQVTLCVFRMYPYHKEVLKVSLFITIYTYIYMYVWPHSYCVSGICFVQTLVKFILVKFTEIQQHGCKRKWQDCNSFNDHPRLVSKLRLSP